MVVIGEILDALAVHVTRGVVTLGLVTQRDVLVFVSKSLLIVPVATITIVVVAVKNKSRYEHLEFKNR